MGLKLLINKTRNEFAFDLRESVLYWFLSPITYAFYRDAKNCINQLQVGHVLDAGAGGLYAKILFNEKYSSYTSLDIENRTGEVDIVGDVQHMGTITSERFDTVFCSQVLEHIPEPAKAIIEFYRILKRGWNLHHICTPHIALSRSTSRLL